MKNFLPVFFTLSVIAIFFSLSSLTGKVSAANAVPSPGNIPCSPDPNSDPEFNSDRPYQASRCGNYNITYWCGNSVVMDIGSVHTDWDPGSCTDSSCQVNFDCTKKGAVNVGGKGGSCSGFQNIIVDLTNVQLPVLGNTQLTKNSQNPTDQIDGSTAVNNYVSQYLNGINDNAQEGVGNNTNDNIINLSGPIKKLLPDVIQEEARTGSILQAIKGVTYTPDSDGGTGTPVPQPTTEPTNHNQIVVCGDSNIPIFGNLFHIGTLKPTDCYKGDGSKAQGGEVLRLKDWNGDLSWWNSILNGIVSHLSQLFPSVPASAIRNSIGNHWNKRIPPLPWDDQGDGTGKPFTSDALYQKAYNEWKGNTCVIIPVINWVVCVNNIFVPNKYADLYPYIPLANTVDKKGVQMVTALVPSAAKATVSLAPHGYDLIKSPQLYLAHSLEDMQLTALLKSTYIPATQSAITGQTVFTPSTPGSPPKDVENNSSQCRIIPSRSNPGDSATFGTPKSYIELDKIDIHVSQISCTTSTNWKCPFPHPSGPCPVPRVPVVTHTCESDVYATIPSIAKYGYADDIWNNTVAGTDSIFKRIYPQTGVNAPLSCIADNPAVSPATYTAESGGKLIRIIENGNGPSVKSADPKGSDSIDAQLYYPHYGGVLDYFLNGIQQALRPKGYGPGQPQNGQYCTNISCGQLPTLPTASGSCSLGSISSRVGSIPQSLKDIVSAASQTYNTPPNLILGIMYGEGIFNPGRFNWTDQNVKNWATCQKIPNCNETGDDNFMGFNGNDFTNIAPHILPDIQKLIPGTTLNSLSQCNLLDTIYAEAYNLHASSAGGGGLPATCFGIALHSTIPNSCSWNDNQYEDAIKVSESGYTSACFTLEGSCATGGGMAATCPGGDNCETIFNRYSNPSHNACVWNVGHGN